MILELPENLRKTVAALLKLGEGTASDVARVTGRGRATESYYLNLLYSLNYVSKKKIGKRTYYFFNKKI